MQLKTIVKCYFKPTKLSIIKKIENTECWQGCRQIGTLVHCRWEYTVKQLYFGFLFLFFYFLVTAFSMFQFSLSVFYSYNTVLPTRITMLYIKSSDLIHFIAERLYPFTSLSIFSSPTNPQQPLLLHSLDSICRVITYNICPSLSDLSHLAQCPEGSSVLL